jgi:uncharacterized membrane protein YebE (DUF533 family)
VIDGKKLLEQFLGTGEQKPASYDEIGKDLQTQAGGLQQRIKDSPYGGLGAGAALGGLAALMLGTKTGRKLGGGAVKMGALAALGGLAYRAYNDWRSGQKPGGPDDARVAETLEAPPANSEFAPSDDREASHMGLVLVRAMIAAAKADGHIDMQERQRILGEVGKLELGDEAQAFLIDELAKPADVDDLAAEAKTPAMAAEIYAASLMAIDTDNAAEKAYLARLADRLRLDPQLVAHLESKVEAVTTRERA